MVFVGIILLLPAQLAEKVWKQMEIIWTFSSDDDSDVDYFAVGVIFMVTHLVLVVFCCETAWIACITSGHTQEKLFAVFLCVTSILLVSVDGLWFLAGVLDLTLKQELSESEQLLWILWILGSGGSGVLSVGALVFASVQIRIVFVEDSPFLNNVCSTET
eukprot:COSAG01_NODE_10583_length_2128_cov_15.765402_2_plen_160_part_00